MQLQISSGNEAPIYQQIVNQIKYLVASGQMGPGDELTPIRALAAQVVVNPNTVARAYMELEREGVVVKRHGAGTFVADRPPSFSKRQQRKVLIERVDSLLAEAVQMGVGLDAVVALVRERSARMPSL